MTYVDLQQNSLIRIILWSQEKWVYKVKKLRGLPWIDKQRLD